MRGIPEKLVEISPDEYIKLSDEERDRILREEYAKRNQIARFLVKKWKNKRSSVYRWLKPFGQCIPLREIFRNDRELYVFLVFKEEEENRKRNVKQKKPTKEKDGENFVNLKNVAQMLGISYRHARRLLKQGKILAIRVGKEYKVISYSSPIEKRYPICREMMSSIKKKLSQMSSIEKSCLKKMRQGLKIGDI